MKNFRAGNLEVMGEDFKEGFSEYFDDELPELKFPSGWRIPTPNEIEYISSIESLSLGKFKQGSYWSFDYEKFKRWDFRASKYLPPNGYGARIRLVRHIK